MARADRFRQLLDVAWGLIREEGTEALSLGHLAEKAGVTKPVVYDHFGSRSGLLAELYKEYDARQNALMEAALKTSTQSLAGRAGVIASSYVECVLRQGREIPGVVAALAGSPELEAIKREYEIAFIERCRAALLPFSRTGSISSAGLWAMIGAAESLSHAATAGELTSNQARDELFEIIYAMVDRQPRSEDRP